MSATDQTPGRVVHTLRPGDTVSIDVCGSEQDRIVEHVPHSTRWRVPLGEDYQTTRVVLAPTTRIGGAKPILVTAVGDDDPTAYTYDNGEATTTRGRVRALELVDTDDATASPDSVVEIDGVDIPVALTEHRVRESAATHVTVAAVADDLGLTVGQARAVLFHLDEYVDVSEARYDDRDRDRDHDPAGGECA